MADSRQEPSKYEALLAQLHERIRDVCADIGINVKAAETHAKQTATTLPWDQSAAPEECLERGRGVLKKIPDDCDLRDDIRESFVMNNSCRASPYGFSSALDIVTDRFLDSEKKAAFLGYFFLEFYEHTANPDYHVDSSPEVIPGVVSWIVHDILAAQQLANSCITADFHKVSDALMHSLALWVSGTSLMAASRDNLNFDLTNQVESALYALAAKEPDTKQYVAGFLKVIATEKTEPGEQANPMSFLEDTLRSIYPARVAPPNLDGERIVRSFDDMFKGFSESCAFAEYLEPRVTSDDAWANPLSAAAADITSGRKHYLYFENSDVVSCPKAREVLLDLVQHCSGTKFVFSADLFFSRAPGDPSFEVLAEELNLVVGTGLISKLMNKTSQRNFSARKEQVLGFLQRVAEAVGRTNVLIVDPETTKTITPTDSNPICVLGAPRYETPENGANDIVITLQLREQNDEAISKLKATLGVMRGALSALVTGAVARALAESGIPALSLQNEDRDSRGLNGYYPRTIVASLSNVDLEQIGLEGLEGSLPHLDPENSTYPMPLLKIVYTGKWKDSEADDPTGVEGIEDDSEGPGDEANTDDLVGTAGSGRSRK
jgi:hypothetical protein